MIKKTIFFTLSILILSCNSDNKNKIIQLEKELENKISKSDSLLKLKHKLDIESEEIATKLNKNLIYEELIYKEEVSSFFKHESKTLLNKENIIRYIFNEYHIGKYNFNAILNSTGILIKREVPLEIIDQYTFCNYIVNKIDRSPESLKKYITPEIKEFVYLLLNENGNYKSSGTDAMVKGLILAHYNTEKELLTDIYSIANNLDYNSSYSSLNNLFTFISDNATDNVKKAVSDENYTTNNATISYSDLKNRLKTIYTFWARRNHEGNADYVNSLLVEIDKNVSENPLK